MFFLALTGIHLCQTTWRLAGISVTTRSKAELMFVAQHQPPKSEVEVNNSTDEAERLVSSYTCEALQSHKKDSKAQDSFTAPTRDLLLNPHEKKARPQTVKEEKLLFLRISGGIGNVFSRSWPRKSFHQVLAAKMPCGTLRGQNKKEKESDSFSSLLSAIKIHFY